jgi:hypothetical protein
MSALLVEMQWRTACTVADQETNLVLKTGEIKAQSGVIDCNRDVDN